MLLRSATFGSPNRGMSKKGGTVKWIGLMFGVSPLSALPSDDIVAGTAAPDAEEARFLFCPEITGFLSSPGGSE